TYEQEPAYEAEDDCGECQGKRTAHARQVERTAAELFELRRIDLRQQPGDQCDRGDDFERCEDNFLAVHEVSRAIGRGEASREPARWRPGGGRSASHGWHVAGAVLRFRIPPARGGN